MTKEKLVDYLDSIIAAGRSWLLKADDWQSLWATAELARIDAGCQNVIRLLGPSGDTWRRSLRREGMLPHDIAEMVGIMEAIREAVLRDLLTTIHNLVFAEAFSDLLEQASHLLEGGYILAAGAVGRAVLEEHLRNWCGRANCVPVPQNNKRPTLQDFINELGRANALNKLEKKHVEWMTAVGNDAAHNKPGLKNDDVERMLRDLRDFLIRNPLS